MRIVKILIVVVLLAIFGGCLFVWSGSYNIAANKPHWAITSEVLEVVRERSIETRAEGLTPPESFPLPLMARAATDYAEMCMQCHLAPGMAPTALQQGLYPQPPVFHEGHGDDHDLREAFWVIKNGIKLTGMPAWGKVHSDDEIWALAQFIDYLPNMSPQKFRQLTGLSIMPEAGAHAH